MKSNEYLKQIKKGIGILKKSKSIQSFGIYTIANVINSAIPFFLLPILTRYLTTEDYGMVSMFNVLISFITPFIGLSLYGAITRVYYEKDTIDVKKYISNCFYIILCMVILVFSIVFIFSNVIEKYFSFSAKVQYVAIIISFAEVIISIVLALWQVQLKAVNYGMFQILQTSCNLLLSILFVVILGMEWKGRIGAHLITALLFSVIGLIILIKNKWFNFKIDFNYIKHALKFGVPLVPHALSAVIMSMVDRLFITNMVGIATTGVYTVGYQIGTIINLITTSASRSYTPWLYKHLKEDKIETKKKIVKMTYLYFLAIILMAICLSLVAPPFLRIFLGKDFGESGIYVIWIAIGYAFNGMYLLVSPYIFYAKKTYYLSLVTVASAVLNIVLNYLLIGKNGAIGAAQSTTIIYLCKFLLTWALASKIYKMPWGLKKK